LRRIFESLGVGDLHSDGAVASMPFSADDITAGSESELQAVVCGDKHAVDLPLVIEESNYYANIVRRVAAGDAPRRIVTELERYLNQNASRTWENSWVRFPARLLSPFARETFDGDLLADKRNPLRGARADRERFFCRQGGEEFVRVPISYLLKLSLADLAGSPERLPAALRATGVRLMAHFLNDNSSPETFSFHVIPMRADRGMGRPVARETARRHLLSQLLVMYANRRFGLERHGQRAMVYFAPHPPVRQKQLNDCISDAFYRELLMSPCLSGWDDGEAKQAYMHLCHQALSRSQINGVAKLREAGIIVNNLVVLPNLSNTSLANNGIHVSLGSRQMTRALREQAPGFGAAEEKYVGDLAIKIVEHFLPLFVGTYSAAPYRFDFADFHPEKALGFLPHELDYTHLRMIWRRWRGKADLSVLGYAITPFGPPWIDRLLSAVFRLRGDWVVDFRLLDYLAALMSTERSPSLDGRMGNGDRLRSDLAALGIFDERMALYQLYRLREFAVMGFSGFEGRYYSLFASLTEDMGRAVDLQALVTALAIKYQVMGRVTHELIPDDPFIESERRQIFFAAAIGLPTFFVRRDTSNRFLQEILKRTTKTRISRRYAGFLRVKLDDYQQALVQLLNEEAADLIEMFGLRETMNDLAERLGDPARNSAAGRLTRGIQEEARHGSPMRLNAAEFNAGAESYYRGALREQHMNEGLDGLIEDLRAPIESDLDEETRRALGDHDAARVVAEMRQAVIGDYASEEELRTLIGWTLLSIRRDIGAAERMLDEGSPRLAAASVY
jgi:hypothetical protein